MDHMESSSLNDVKASSEDNEEAGTDSLANTSKIVAAQSITSKSVESPGPGSGSVGFHDESALLEDVKVCDICGDAGREDLLATCSKCSDGAEHIYCMRVRLEKVPDSDWICEDCLLSEYKDKRRQTRFSNPAATPKHDKNEAEVEATGASNVKINATCDSKGMDIDKNRRDKLSSQPSAKRPLGNVQSALLARRRALGLDNVLVSRQYGKAPKTPDFSVKSNHESPLPKNLSGTREDADLSTVLGQNFPKSHQLLTSSGVFTKSKSFNGSDRRPKVQFLEKNPEKQKFLCETAVGTKGKSGTFKSLKKSLSFSYGSAGRSNAHDVEAKTSTPKLSEVSDLKRLRATKECSSAEVEVKPVLKKPRILSPDGSLSSASSGNKKFACHSEPIAAHFSGIKCSDTKTAQSLIESGTASADEEKPSTKSNPSQELKNKGEVSSNSSLTSRRHLTCSDATGQAKLPVQERPSHQNPRAPQSSDSRLNDGCTSNGTGSVLCHKSETVTHATNCHTENSSVSASDMARENDRSKSCGRDLAATLCCHLNVNGSTAVPMFDYIWKGEFQVNGSVKLPGVLCRIQAHLSTQSSPKIPEVVKKFSDKILLEEVPRLTTWPIQFLEYQPRDDSIGLYFFAQDVESYSKYKTFLQCMTDHDLALKGNFNGIELLIFSSTLLPEKSRCWNRLLFLWGIFKQRTFTATT